MRIGRKVCQAFSQASAEFLHNELYSSLRNSLVAIKAKHFLRLRHKENPFERSGAAICRCVDGKSNVNQITSILVQYQPNNPNVCVMSTFRLVSSDQGTIHWFIGFHVPDYNWLSELLFSFWSCARAFFWETILLNRVSPSLSLSHQYLSILLLIVCQDSQILSKFTFTYQAQIVFCFKWHWDTRPHPSVDDYRSFVCCVILIPICLSNTC